MPEMASSKAKGPSAEQKVPEANGKGSASILPDQAERSRKINELRKLIEGKHLTTSSKSQDEGWC